MKKRILCGALIILVVLGAIIISFMFKDTSQYNVALREESIIVSINPEVLFNTDNKGKVKEVLPINEDAKIYKEEDFLGLEIKKAVDKTIEVAKEHGYVKEDTVVNVSSLSENSIYVEDIVLNLKGNKINVKTKKIPKDAIETIMSNIDTTSNVETEFIVLDDGYVIIRKHSNIEGPGPSDDELNNQIENNNSNNNKQEDEQKKEENKQNPTTSNSNQNNTNNNSNKNEETTNNTKPIEKAYLNSGSLYSLDAVKEIENKYNIKINLVADAKCGYIDGGDNQLIESGKTYTVHIASLDPFVYGTCGIDTPPEEWECLENDSYCAMNLFSTPELLSCAKQLRDFDKAHTNYLNSHNNNAPLLSELNISAYNLLYVSDYKEACDSGDCYYTWIGCKVEQNTDNGNALNIPLYFRNE